MYTPGKVLFYKITVNVHREQPYTCKVKNPQKKYDLERFPLD